MRPPEGMHIRKSTYFGECGPAIDYVVTRSWQEPWCSSGPMRGRRRDDRGGHLPGIAGLACGLVGGSVNQSSDAIPSRWRRRGSRSARTELAVSITVHTSFRPGGLCHCSQAIRAPVLPNAFHRGCFLSRGRLPPGMSWPPGSRHRKGAPKWGRGGTLAPACKDGVARSGLLALSCRQPCENNHNVRKWRRIP
jgi:hypothetical protein